MSNKKLQHLCVENFLTWMMAVTCFAFIASTFVPYLSGTELSNVSSFMWGLLLERTFAAFAFVHDCSHVRAQQIGG